MNYDHICKVNLLPHVSEKATRVGEKHNQYVFKVAKSADKAAIRYAVEKLFGVSVTSVNVTNLKPEQRRTARGKAVRRGYRKAYVTVQQGQEITFNADA